MAEEPCSQSFWIDTVGLVAAVELTVSYDPSRLSFVSPPSEDNETEWKDEVEELGICRL